MTRSRLSAFLAALVVLLAGTSAARAQGLGDAAARERQKREAQKSKEPPRVFDNQDLPEHEPEKGDKNKGTDKAAEPTPPPPMPGAEGSGASDAGSVLAARRNRIAQAESAVSAAKADVDRIEARIRQLQDMLNPMSPSYIYGSASSGDMAGAEARARSELQQAEVRLAEARKALAAANQSLEDAQLGRLPSPSPQS
jgi:peptidoglycan hydrolase CwlO-like protein